MKLNREQIINLFGSAPKDQDGKNLVGCKVRPPKVGEWFLDLDFEKPTWEVETRDGKSDYHYPVAIFEDTHRQDGTPLDIDPLPEIEGYRVEYFGTGLNDLGDADRYIYYRADGYKGWDINHYKSPLGINSYHYARLFKIAKPTTLADLVGDDGQKVVWIMLDDHQKAQSLILVGADESFDFFFAEATYSIEELSKRKARWSHSPFTKYEDAKEFVI